MSDMDVIVTKHAYDMGKSRLSLKKNSISNIAKKAFNTGLSHHQAKGSLKKYVTKLFFKNKKANNIKIYGENVFIFSNNILVTLYRIPSDLIKILKVSRK